MKGDRGDAGNPVSIYSLAGMTKKEWLYNNIM